MIGHLKDFDNQSCLDVVIEHASDSFVGLVAEVILLLIREVFHDWRFRYNEVFTATERLGVHQHIIGGRDDGGVVFLTAGID